MRISDIYIDVREDDEIAVTRWPDSVRLDLGHGTPQSVTVTLTAEKAVELGRALTPADGPPADATADPEWPCEPMNAGDRVQVKEVPGVPGRYDDAEGTVTQGTWGPGYIGVSLLGRKADRTLIEPRVHGSFVVAKWRRIGGDAA